MNTSDMAQAYKAERDEMERECLEVRALAKQQQEQIKQLRDALQSIKDNGGPTMENGWPGRVCSDVAQAALAATDKE